MQANHSPYIYLQEIQSYFENFSQKITKREYWLEFNGSPLNWDNTLGCVIDLFRKQKDGPIFNFVFHLRNCPTEILKLENMSEIKSRFLHSLKDVREFVN